MSILWSNACCTTYNIYLWSNRPLGGFLVRWRRRPTRTEHDCTKYMYEHDLIYFHNTLSCSLRTTIARPSGRRERGRMPLSVCVRPLPLPRALLACYFRIEQTLPGLAMDTTAHRSHSSFRALLTIAYACCVNTHSIAYPAAACIWCSVWGTVFGLKVVIMVRLITTFG